jgi:2-succinyl-6-hydroxy-2,4-cyclohexadiene-1-carboxylate synthase
MRDVEHREADVGDGLVLHAEIVGDGPPVVLLHGFTGSTASWTPLRAVLQATHRVVSVDLPGHGRSSTPTAPERLALPRLADDLARVLDLLGVARSAMLGYSLGGRAALHFAVRHPDRLTALVLESASPGIADPAERARRIASDGELASEIEREGIDAFVRRWESLAMWESQAGLPAHLRAALRAQRLANDPHALATSLRGAGAGATPALSAETLSIPVPTLLIAGSLDAKYLAIARHLAGVIPGARLAVVDGAGHAVHLERPDEFAVLVRDFLCVR